MTSSATRESDDNRLPRRVRLRTRRAVLVSALAALAMSAASCAAVHEYFHGNRAGGSLVVDGPMRVDGDLTVGGSAVVHGQVLARHLDLGGSIVASLPRNETAGPAPQVVEGSMRVEGSINVNGPLTVNGTLKIGGSLVTETGEMPRAYTDLPPTLTNSGAR